jgi:hypothetical protein
VRFFAPLAVVAALSFAAFQAVADDAPAKSKESPAQEAPATDQAPKEKPSGPQPKLVIESTEHQFGDVTPGTPLEYSFEIKNTGDADLQILRVKPSCGCTSSAFDSLVTPGHSGHITLMIKNTKVYKGTMAKSARVDTNDPENPTLNLILRAEFPKPDLTPPADKGKSADSKDKDKPAESKDKEKSGDGR